MRLLVRVRRLLWRLGGKGRGLRLLVRIGRGLRGSVRIRRLLWRLVGKGRTLRLLVGICGGFRLLVGVGRFLDSKVGVILSDINTVFRRLDNGSLRDII